MNTEEYVPDKIPNNKTKQNDFIVVPPNTNKLEITTKVVIDVLIVLVSVCCIAKLQI